MNLLKKCERLDDSRTDSVNLVEYLPLFVGNPELLGCLDGSPQLARPHLQIWQFVLLDEILQGVGELWCEREVQRLF